MAAGRSTNRAGSPQEPVIVEYPQDACAVFTIGDSSCPSVAKLLKLVGAVAPAGAMLLLGVG